MKLDISYVVLQRILSLPNKIGSLGIFLSTIPVMVVGTRRRLSCTTYGVMIKHGQYGCLIWVSISSFRKIASRSLRFWRFYSMLVRVSGVLCSQQWLGVYGRKGID